LTIKRAIPSPSRSFAMIIPAWPNSATNRSHSRFSSRKQDRDRILWAEQHADTKTWIQSWWLLSSFWFITCLTHFLQVRRTFSLSHSIQQIAFRKLLLYATSKFDICQLNWKVWTTWYEIAEVFQTTGLSMKSSVVEYAVTMDRLLKIIWTFCSVRYSRICGSYWATPISKLTEESQSHFWK
jgi:hypothetical protein